MIDFKKTLINLHKKFPEYDLDKLIEIIDAIVETSDYNTFNYPSINKPSLSNLPKMTSNQTAINISDKWMNIISNEIQIKNPHDTFIY